MIEIKNISKYFDGRCILSNISMEIADGQIITILGNSGSGKTTLANIIAQSLFSDSGKIVIDGCDILNLKRREKHKRRSEIQLIPQHPYSSFNPRKTLLYSISEGAIFLGLTTKENAIEYLKPFMNIVGLEIDLIFKKPHELSGGEIQKAAIARSLSVKPRLIISDEITSALDAISAREIADAIKAISKTGCSIIFITHDIEIGKYVANKCFLLKDSLISPYVFS